MERITPADVAQMREGGCDPSTIAAAEDWLAKCVRADELIELVTEAFAGVQLEEGIGLRESDGIEDYAGPEELKRLRAADEKDDWRKISAELLVYCNAAPSCLDAKGMRFHTPAFIVAELKGEFEQGFIDRLISGFYSATEFPDLLSKDQRRAIVECIRFYGSLAPDVYSSENIAAAVARFSEGA